MSSGYGSSLRRSLRSILATNFKLQSERRAESNTRSTPTETANEQCCIERKRKARAVDGLGPHIAYCQPISMASIATPLF